MELKEMFDFRATLRELKMALIDTGIALLTLPFVLLLVLVNALLILPTFFLMFVLLKMLEIFHSAVKWLSQKIQITRKRIVTLIREKIRRVEGDRSFPFPGPITPLPPRNRNKATIFPSGTSPTNQTLSPPNNPSPPQNSLNLATVGLSRTPTALNS